MHIRQRAAPGGRTPLRDPRRARLLTVLRPPSPPPSPWAAAACEPGVVVDLAPGAVAPPETDAASYVVADLGTGEVLAASPPDEQLLRPARSRCSPR